MPHLRHTGTLPTSTCALISLAELPASATSSTTPLLLKTYLRSDVARHDLTSVVQAERTALVRLSEDRSGLVARLMSASVSPTALTLTMVRAPGTPAMHLPRPMPPARAARITRQLIDALQRVHAVDVVHADVTLRNVIVDVANGDAVCLVDFGSCFVRGGAQRDPSFTTSAHVLAPELLSGRPPDPISDVWAAGIFTWALLFGGPGPFGASGSSDASVLEELQSFADGKMNIASAFQSASQSLDSVSAEELACAHDFVTRCLARDPKDRFMSPASCHGAVVSTWSEVIDYERIKSHPFPLLHPD